METSSQDVSAVLSAEAAAAQSTEAATAADLALHNAARAGDAVAVATLLSQSDSAARLKRRDAHERTPLHVACFANHVEVVNLLLSGGASANATAQVRRVVYRVRTLRTTRPSYSDSMTTKHLFPPFVCTTTHSSGARFFTLSLAGRIQRAALREFGGCARRRGRPSGSGRQTFRVGGPQEANPAAFGGPEGPRQLRDEFVARGGGPSGHHQERRNAV